MSKKPNLDEINEKIRQAQYKSTTPGYSDALNKALFETYEYGKANDQNRLDVANTIIGGGGMTSLNTGDIGGFDWDNQKQTELDRVKSTKFFRDMGLFDTRDYATHKGYTHMTSLGYLNDLLSTIGEEVSASQQKDKDMDALRQQTAETSSRWLDLKNADNETEMDRWYNMLMADYLLGDRNELFDFEAIDARYGDMSDEEYYREYQRLTDQWNNLDWDTLTGSRANGYQSQTAGLQGQYKTVSDEVTRRTEMNALQADIRGAADYGALSVYTDTYVAPEKGTLGYIFTDEPFINGYDNQMRFMNSNASWDDKTLAAEYSGNVQSYLDKGYDYLTADELADYNYLINAGRTEDAARYLELLSPELLYRRAMVMKEYQSVKATNPLLSVPTWVDAGIQQIENVFNLPVQIYEAWTGKDNPYSAAWDAYNKSRWTSEAQLGLINDAEIPDWADKALSFLYTGASGARDNFTRLLASGFNPTGALILAGAQSGSGSLHDSSQRNDMSGAAKIIKAIGTAAIEVGTEKIGLDALFDRGQKGAIEYLLGSMGAEIGEETLNAMSEPVLEAVVAFLFDHEAEIMSGEDFWKNLTDTAITTAISSLFMSGGSAIQMDAGTRKQGKNLQQNGDIEAVLKIAEELGGNIYDSKGKYTQAESAAQEIREMQKNGKNVGPRHLGKLINAITVDMREQEAQALNAVLEDSIQERLVELGEDSGNAKKLAPVIRNVYQGKKITLADRASLHWTDNAEQVVKEMVALDKAETQTESVPGATQAPEGERVGQRWATETKGRIAEVAVGTLGRQYRLQQAMTSKKDAVVEASANKVAERQKGKPKLKIKEISYIDSQGAKQHGTFEKVVKKGGKFFVAMRDAHNQVVEVDADAIDNAEAGLATIIEHAAHGAKHDMSAEEVNILAATYQQKGGDIKAVIRQFEDSYLAGYSGLDKPAGTDTIDTIAYEHGAKEADQDEKNRVEKAKRARRNAKPRIAWLGDIDSDADVTGMGDEAAMDEEYDNLTEGQQMVAEFSRHLAEQTGLNVVLFRSKARDNGEYTTQNGSYDSATNTIYLDVNAGNLTAKDAAKARKEGTLGYAIMRTMGHEVTHAIEATSPTFYAQYRDAAKQELLKAGKDWTGLVRAKLDNAVRNGEKLTYGGAVAEVVADASEYMLQDSAFVNNLNTSLKGKVKAVIQDFAAKIKAAFRNLTGGSEEARALRNSMGQYNERLQKLWDAAFVEMQNAGEAYEYPTPIVTDGDRIVDATEVDWSIGDAPMPTYRQFSEEEENAGAFVSYADEAMYETGEIYSHTKQNSLRVRDKATIEYLENQPHITTYRAMQVIDGKLYPPMSEFVGTKKDGSREDPGILGHWEMATEHPELIKWVNGKPKFELKKTNDDGSVSTVPAAYNPYMHSSNTVLNDQFSKAFQRKNLVVVECVVPVSESDGAYRAQYAKDATGWHEWKAGVVAGDLAKQKAGFRRDVFLSRYIKPVRILPDAEVAEKIAGYLDGTDVTVPFQSVWPTLRDALVQEGVAITEPRGLAPAQMKIATEAFEEWKNHYADEADQGTVQYSSRAQDQLEEDKYYARTIDKWDGKASGGRMKVGSIKENSIYTAVGLPAGELYFDYSKAAAALSKHGDHLTKDLMKQVPAMLASPIVITEPINRQVKNTINVFGEMMGDNGKLIMVSIMMRPDVSGTYMINIVRTIEMRSDTQKLITPATLLYIDSNKKRVRDWFLRLGNSSVPFAVNQYGLIRSIQRVETSVKPEGEAASNETSPVFQSDALTLASELENTDGKRAFSLRSMTDDYDTYRNMLVKAGTPSNEVQELFHVIDETMKQVEAHKDILDFGWNVGREQRSFNPVKPNSDSLYKVSVDFSSLCRKRLLQQAVQERLEAKYDTVLTKAERVAIRNALMELREQGKQIEVACALCYVESTRLKSPAQIQRFFDDRRKVLVDYLSKNNKEYKRQIDAQADELIVKFGYESGTPLKQLSSFQRNAVHDLKRSMYKAYKPTAEEEAIIKTAMELPGEMFKTAEGLWKLKREHEVIFDAYTSFVRNATKSKGIESDEAWWAGDSENISNNLIEQMNAENGLRSQSWSDFQVIHLLDYMAAIIELSTRNAKMQTYTKVPDFVKLMGDTGIMINLSLIPNNFDGTLNYDPIEGMPIETALMLREMFPDTAGTICIGITDEHIRLLLENGNIDYVIPYHKSSMDAKTRQQMGMKNWQDYEAAQSEKPHEYSNTVMGTDTYHKAPRFSEWFNYETVSARAKVVGAEQAMREAADRYIELCHRRGLQEKFPQFANEANYWKLLIDRKMINQRTGEIINQQAVKPRFDLDRISEILQGEVDRFAAQNKDFNEAIKHIEHLWDDGEIRKAAKSKKVMDAVSAFDASVVVQNIVESAKELDAPARQLSLRDHPSDVTVREFLTDADASIADTVEERNALTIYQKLLKKHATVSEAVIAAEEALDKASEEDKLVARKMLAAARAEQKNLYNRLLDVERTAHVQSVVKRSQQIVGDLYGKKRSEVDKMVSDLEKKAERLRSDLQGLKGAAKVQQEADIRAAERNLAAYKSKAAQALLANSEKYQQQIANIRLRRDINAEIGKRTRHIKRIVKLLDDRIRHEEDYKNVKEPLKPTVHQLVRTFIDGFGNLVFDTKTANRLRTVYDAIANEDAAPEFYSDDVANWLTDLAALAEEDQARRAAGGSTLESAQWKLDTYSKVAGIADHIYKMVTAADEIFVNGKRESFAAISEEVGNALNEVKDKALLVGAARNAKRLADDLLRTGNMTPTYFFQHLKNSGLSKLFDGMMNGQTEYAQAVRQGRDAIHDAKQKYNFHSWQHMKHGVEFRTEQGHTIALTTPQMMWVYATAKREATNKLMDTHHLDQGGFRYEANDLPRQKGKMTAIPGSDRLHKLSAADVKKITDTLTAEQKACADELVSYLSNECAAQGNRASMELFGIMKYNEEYYFPFKTASDQRYQHSAEGSTSTTNDARVKHTSFTHSLRKGANTPLVMGDFFDVIADHINQMATYASFVVPIESMNRVLNAKVNEEADGSGNDVTIRSLVARKHGEPAQKYMADLLKDLNGGPQTDNRGAVSAMFRAFKRGAVMGSLSVSLQQPTAIARAFAYVNPKYFAHITMEGNQKTWERMMKYSGTAVIKDMGKFDVGTGKMADDWIANSDLQDFNVWKRGKFLLDTQGFNAAKNNWVEWATQLPGVMDRITWTHIWKAIEAEQADANPGMDRNSEEFQRAVGQRFDYVINRTQVYDSILSKSQNMRSKNAFAQMSTAFMAEPTLNINMLYDAVANKHTAGERAGIITSVVTSSILAAAMASLIAAWNKDDDERKWQEKYLAEFASRAVDSVNPLTMIPYVADVWNMVNGYDIERTDLSVVKDVIDYTTTFVSKATDPDKANTWRDYENLFGTISNLTGIPAKNLSRDIRRVRNFLATDKSASSKAAIKYTLLENVTPLGLYKDSSKAYCQRLVAAEVDGDTQESYDLWDYLTNSKKPTQNTINTNIRDELKRRVREGSMTPSQATEILRKYAPYVSDKDNINKPKEWAE